MIIGIMGHMGVGKDTFADHLVKKHGFVKVSFADPLKRICKEVYDFSDEQLWGPSSERNKPDLRYPRGRNEPVCARCAITFHPEGTKVGVGADGEGRCFYCGVRQVKSQLIKIPVFLTPRIALQLLGTEWGRNCYQNTWVDYVLRVVSLILDEGYDYDQKVGVHNQAYSPDYYGYAGIVIPDVRFQNEVEAILSKGGIVIGLRRTWAQKVELHGIENHASEQEMSSIPEEFYRKFDVPPGIEAYHQAIDALMAELLG